MNPKEAENSYSGNDVWWKLLEILNKDFFRGCEYFFRGGTGRRFFLNFPVVKKTRSGEIVNFFTTKNIDRIGPIVF